MNTSKEVILDAANSMVEQLRNELESLTKERDELKIKLLEVAHLKYERDRYRTALMAILNYPVHSEPVGGAYAMSDIADAALKGGPK